MKSICYFSSLLTVLLHSNAAGRAQVPQIISIFLDGDSGGAGLMSVRSTNGSARIQLDGLSSVAGGRGGLSVIDRDGTETIELLGAENTQQGGKLTLRSDSAVVNAQIRAEEFGGTGDGEVIELFNIDLQEIMGSDGDSPGGGVSNIYNTSGASAAASGDIVLFRANHYSRLASGGTPLKITKPLTLRSRRGNSTIRLSTLPF